MKPINWQEIDTVLLDMDGTLLDLHFDNYFWHHYLPERYCDFHNVSLEHAHDTLKTLINDRVGTLQWYCLDHWSELVGMDIPMLKHDIKNKILVRPFVEEFLSSLRDVNKQIVLVTNSHPKGLELKLNVTNIKPWLDVIVSSHEFQAPKEDQVFWQRLSQKVSFDPSRTLFVDDTARILQSAKNFGVKHLLLITEPDSQKQRMSNADFNSVAHFDELLPLKH